MGAPTASPRHPTHSPSSQPLLELELPSPTSRRAKRSRSEAVASYPPVEDAEEGEEEQEQEQEGREQQQQDEQENTTSTSKSTNLPPSPPKRRTRSASLKGAPPTSSSARKGPLPLTYHPRRSSYAESDSSLTSLEDSADDSEDSHDDNEVDSPASSVGKKLPSASKARMRGEGEWSMSRKKAAVRFGTSSKKPAFLATAMTKAELIRGAFSSETPLTPIAGQIRTYLPEPVEEEDEEFVDDADDADFEPDGSEPRAPTGRPKQVRRKRMSSATGEKAGGKKNKTSPVSKKTSAPKKATMSSAKGKGVVAARRDSLDEAEGASSMNGAVSQQRQRIKTVFTPPASMPKIQFLFSRRHTILQEARTEATRDADLQTQSERAIQSALEALPQGIQQSILCLTMNRYTAFCGQSSVDVPTFPITNSKLSLFFARVPCTSLSDLILATFPRLPSDQYPLPQAGVVDPALAPEEGSFVTRELLRSWVDAMAYAQIATKGIWEGVLAPVKRSKKGSGSNGFETNDGLENVVHPSLKTISEDEAIREILRAVESRTSVQTVAFEAELARAHAPSPVRVQAETGAASTSAPSRKGKERAVEEDVSMEGEESGPEKKRTKWTKGGKTVLGPSPGPGLRASSASSSGSAQRRANGFAPSSSHASSFAYPTVPQPLYDLSSRPLTASSSRAPPRHQQLYDPYPLRPDPYTASISAGPSYLAAAGPPTPHQASPALNANSAVPYASPSAQFDPDISSPVNNTSGRSSTTLINDGVGQLSVQNGDFPSSDRFSPQPFHPHQRRHSHSHSLIEQRVPLQSYDATRRASVAQQPSSVRDLNASAVPFNPSHSSSRTWSVYGDGDTISGVGKASQLTPVVEHGGEASVEESLAAMAEVNADWVRREANVQEHFAGVVEQLDTVAALSEQQAPGQLGGDLVGGLSIQSGAAFAVATEEQHHYPATALQPAVEASGVSTAVDGGRAGGADAMSSTVVDGFEEGATTAVTAERAADPAQEVVTTAMLAQQELEGLQQAIVSTAASSPTSTFPPHQRQHHLQQQQQPHPSPRSVPMEREMRPPVTLSTSFGSFSHPSSAYAAHPPSSSMLPPASSRPYGDSEYYDEREAYSQRGYYGRHGPATAHPYSTGYDRQCDYPSSSNRYDYPPPVASSSRPAYQQGYPSPTGFSPTQSRHAFPAPHRPSNASGYTQHYADAPPSSRYHPTPSVQHEQQFSRRDPYYSAPNYASVAQREQQRYGYDYDPHHSYSRQDAASFYPTVSTNDPYSAQPPPVRHFPSVSSASSSSYGAPPHSYPTPETPGTAFAGGEGALSMRGPGGSGAFEYAPQVGGGGEGAPSMGYQSIAASALIGLGISS